jgi:hypothetical protein
METYQIAQVNIAHLIAPEGDPLVSGFFDNIDRINHLAESSDGFVWRYEGDYPDPLLAFNLSVWQSIEQLSQFVYRSAHVEIFRDRQNWFQAMDKNHMALWWVRAGQRPSVEDSLQRLATLDKNGPSAEAFTFKQRFSASA